MTINIIHETENYWIIDKPAGLTVHPGAGEQITFTDIWAKKFPDWAKLNWLIPERPGIVHRLDKDTSGVMIVAKNPESLNKLQELFSNRTAKKQYRALCVGDVKESEFEVEASVSRDSNDRKKQTTSLLDLPWEQKAKEAKTKFELIKKYEIENFTISELLCFPETGRMHQIRVHLKLKNLPILGDAKYANKISKKFNQKFSVNRQMLHAETIEFVDPWTSQNCKFHASFPEDWQNLIKLLAKSLS